MKLLLTGHPGFLAREIKTYFEKSNWTVDTLGLCPDLEAIPGQQHIVCDLASSIPQLSATQYDLVIHAAGKAHVIPRTQAERQQFYDVNVKGTMHLLEALRATPPKALLFISSVAVYGLEEGIAIAENQALNAKDPYGASKAQAEELIRDFPFSQEVIRGIVRLPLIAGRNAPGNLGSMLRAVKEGRFFNVSKGKARRSAVLLSDIPAFLKCLGEHGGIYNFTDGQDFSFAELYSEFQKVTSCPKRFAIPYWAAWLLAAAGEGFQKGTGKPFLINFCRLHKMTHDLTFDGSKALRELNFTPHRVLDNLHSIV